LYWFDIDNIAPIRKITIIYLACYFIVIFRGRKKKSSSQSHEAHDWAFPSWLAPNPSSDTRLSNRNWKETLDPVTSGYEPVDEDDNDDNN